MRNVYKITYFFCRVGQNSLLNTVPGGTHCNEMGDFHNMMIFTAVQLMTITKMSSVIYNAMATLMSLLRQKPFVCDKAKKSVSHAYYRGLKSVTVDNYLRLQFIILMTDTWRVKHCIIIIIIILKSVFAQHVVVPVQMYPASEDNYGMEACSIL